MIFGVVLILLGGFVAAMNWYAPIQSRLEGRHVSMVPLVGAAMLGVGIYLITGSVIWSWLAIPLDLGTLVLLICLPWMVSELWKTSSFNELAKFYAHDNGRDIYITLYKNALGAIRQEYNGAVGPQEYGAIPCSRIFVIEWQLVDGVFHLSETTGSRKIELTPKGDGYTSSETTVESDARPYTLMGDLIFTQTKCQIAE